MRNYFYLPLANMTDREIIVLAMISKNSDANNRSNISREKLHKLTGIRIADISAITTSLVKKGLLKKTYTYLRDGSKLVHYEVVDTKRYILISQDIFKTSITLKGLAFLVKLASLNKRAIKVDYWMDLYKELGITRPTFTKYAKQLTAAGVIEIVGNVIKINGDYIYCPEITKKQVKRANILTKVDLPIERHNKLLYALANKDSIDNWDAFLDYIESGVPTKRTIKIATDIHS